MTCRAVFCRPAAFSWELSFVFTVSDPQGMKRPFLPIYNNNNNFFAKNISLIIGELRSAFTFANGCQTTQSRYQLPHRRHKEIAWGVFHFLKEFCFQNSLHGALVTEEMIRSYFYWYINSFLYYWSAKHLIDLTFIGQVRD